MGRAYRLRDFGGCTSRVLRDLVAVALKTGWVIISVESSINPRSDVTHSRTVTGESAASECFRNARGAECGERKQKLVETL